MTKFDIRRFLFDIDKVEEELIMLLSVFNASSSNQTKLESLFKVNKIVGYSIIEVNIIQRTTISTAITLRMIDDRVLNNLKKVVLNYKSVGVLISGQKTLPLTFREACNKIVHSNEFSLSTLQSDNDQTDFLEGFIILKGNKGKEEWIAKIEVYKYVINGLCLAKYYDEDWEISTR